MKMMMTKRPAAILILCLGMGAFAQDYKPLPVIKAPEEPGYSGDDHNARFSVGPSFGLLEGVAGVGASTSLVFRLKANLALYVGLESGFYHWSSGGVSISSIPILPTLYYRVRISGSNVTPYFGASVGISVTIGSLAFYGSASEIDFMGLARPGIEFELDRQTSFYVEPKLGIIGSTFVFLPNVGVTFSF